MMSAETKTGRVVEGTEADVDMSLSPKYVHVQNETHQLAFNQFFFSFMYCYYHVSLFTCISHLHFISHASLNSMWLYINKKKKLQPLHHYIHRLHITSIYKLHVFPFKMFLFSLYLLFSVAIHSNEIISTARKKSSRQPKKTHTHTTNSWLNNA